MEAVADVVSSHVLRIAQRRRPTLAAVEPEQRLIEDLGLESLDIAELVAALEMALSKDPFADASVSITDCQTVGALCRAYAA